jgi:hypothetical protein
MAKKLVIKDGAVDNIIEVSGDFSIDGCELVDYQDGAEIGHSWDGNNVVIPAPSALSAEQLRFNRNDLLRSSDWTQMNDSPLSNEQKTAWATYRQELRDITDLDAWPNLANEDWPVEP